MLTFPISLERNAVNITLVEDRTLALMDQLFAVWRASVEATHDFLAPADIDRIATYVPDALRGVDQLAIATDDAGAPLGFAGVQDEVLEMLFIHPSTRGQGIGRTLLAFAVSELGARLLDVNEQNPQAQGFYEHCGWRVIGRSETDEQGEPYPILHMELPPTHAELTEAKHQIDSTLHKLRATLSTLEAKNEPARYRSQITLAQRRIRAFGIANRLIETEIARLS